MHGGAGFGLSQKIVMHGRCDWLDGMTPRVLLSACRSTHVKLTAAYEPANEDGAGHLQALEISPA